MRTVRKRWIRVLFVTILSAFCFVGACLGEESLLVRRVGNIVCFSENAFQVTAPEKGILTIRIHDDVSVYREIVSAVLPGEQTIVWDGCGYHREKLYPKSYTITAVLDSDSGKQYTVSFLSPIEYTNQSLQYVLPSASEAFLSDADDWFLEFRTVMKGNVVIRFSGKDDGKPEYEYHLTTVGGKLNRRTLSAIAGNRIPEPGNYTVTVYEMAKPQESYQFDLLINEHRTGRQEVFVTGEILPERGMTDEEIWEIMMRPSVVVDIDFFKHQTVYAEPDFSGEPLGTLHGQTQALKVIAIRDGWARVGAWNHEDAGYMEGWVPADRLKVEYPQNEYGLLIDKRKQTLTIYRRGEKLDTLLVSTGRPEYRKYDLETSAGSFLTGYHRVDFSTNGKKYDYVIQYDGGNMLHQTPYEWGTHKKDFTYGRGYLGAKASHACIRIQAEPGDGGLNAYWLWTHLPYHTRVVILDDEEERTENIRKLQRKTQSGPDGFGGIIRYEFPRETQNSADVAIIFGGDTIPGGRKSVNAKESSFVTLVTERGCGWVFSALQSVFCTDDLTVVNLRGILTDETDPQVVIGDTPFAPSAVAGVFGNSSIELVNLSDDSVYTAGGEAVRETAEAVGRYASGVSVLQRGVGVTRELKGHLFGFACCSQSEYLKDPGVIDRRIGELRDAGCERIVFLSSWGDLKEPSHTIIQEAMAHRSIRAGADLVIGHHPSEMQGIDYIEGVPVVYGLGKMVDGSTAASSGESGILVRSVFSFEKGEDPVRIEIIPIRASGEKPDDYAPTDDIPLREAQSVIRRIVMDSTDLSVRKTVFCPRNQ